MGSKHCKVFLDTFVVHYEFPAKLYCDQGQNVECNVIKELCLVARMGKSRTTPYHPRVTGMVEQFTQTLR